MSEPEPTRTVNKYPEGHNFLQDYAFYNSNNEAPRTFHVFSGVSVMASVISRRVWLEQGYFTFYPNMYIVMVGDPGGGKSTALDVAKAFVRKMPGMPLAADATTTQALLRHMSEDGSPCKKSVKIDGKGIVEYTPITIFAGELVSFVGMDPYGWVTFLTTVYHEEVHEVKTKNKGDDLIKGPYVNLLGCMTPDITANLLQQRIISSGFARRTIFVWGSGRGEPQPFPYISDEQRAALKRCFEWSLHLQKVKGAFVWTEEAKDFYGPWYIHLRKNIKKLGTPSTAGYYESKHVQLLKVAMILSLCESDSLVLELHHLKDGLNLLEEVEKDMHKVFEGQGRNPESGVAAKIVNMIELATAPILQKVIYATFYNDATREEIDRIIHHLIVTDRITRDDVIIKGKTYGPYLIRPDQKKWLQGLGQQNQTPDAQPSDVPEIDLN